MNGQTVKALRTQQGLSRAALAEKVGITPTHLWRLEKDLIANPGHNTVVNLAAALGVKPEQLNLSQPKYKAPSPLEPARGF